MNGTITGIVTPAFMIRHGLTLIHHRIMQSNAENLANFKCAYGVSPEAAASIWNDLLQSNIVAIRLEPGARVDHLFWMLYFLKVYPKGRNLAATFQASQKTIMVWVKYYMNKLVLQKTEKV